MTSEKTNASSKKNEITGVLLIGLGALFAVSVYFGVESVFGTGIRNLLFGLGGVIGYLVPVVLIFLGFLFIAAKKHSVHKGKQLLVLLVLLLVFTMCHIAVVSRIFVAGESYGSFLAASYDFGTADRAGGGIIGALLAYPLYTVLGTAASWICLICGTVACLIALTNLSLRQLSADLGTAVRTGCRDLAAKAEAGQTRRETRRAQQKSDLYVENVGAARAAERRAHEQAEDPFNLHIQSRDQKRPAKRKRFTRTAPDTQADSLDLRTFAPRRNPVSKPPVFHTLEAELPPEIPEDMPVNGESSFAPSPEDTVPGAPAAVPEEEEKETYDPDPYRRVFADTDIEFETEPVLEVRGRRLVGTEKNSGQPDTPLHILSPGAQENPAAVPENPPPQKVYHLDTGEGRADSAASLALMEETEKEQAGAYQYPPLELLDAPSPQVAVSPSRLQENARRLEEALTTFRVRAQVVNILQGPVVTRYELQPAPGTKVSKFRELADDIALNLAAKSIRIEAPVPGKSVVGIEVPNDERETVSLRSLLEDPKYRAMGPVSFALGKDITGTNVFADISRMPHLLIAGQTGAGKSVCVNSLVVSLLYHSSPEDVQMMMIDPKVVELSVFNNIPHLIAPVVTDPKKATLALNWAVNEMEKRYNDFALRNVKELRRYNEVLQADGEKKLPHIVVIVDELADLMMTSAGEVEEAITRIAQKGRAAGIHLVLATQRPTTNVVTGLIKANVPARVAFSVKSSMDSRVILDSVGAEKLLGYGDMLFYTTGLSNPERIQGCLVTDKEVERVAEFLYTPQEERYDQAVRDSIEGMEEAPHGDEKDTLFHRAVEVALENEQASTSLLQRRLKVGYSRAARLIDQLEGEGIVSGQNGSKPRQVLITREEYEQMYGNDAS